jgi:hypothetical protein
VDLRANTLSRPRRLHYPEVMIKLGPIAALEGLYTSVQGHLEYHMLVCGPALLVAGETNDIGHKPWFPLRKASWRAPFSLLCAAIANALPFELGSEWGTAVTPLPVHELMDQKDRNICLRENIAGDAAENSFPQAAMAVCAKH